MSENIETLIVFASYPLPGETKASLVPALGEQGAAEFQRQMTEHALSQARQAGVPIEVWYTGGSEKQMRTWLGDDLFYVDQGTGEPGERIGRAFESVFGRGAKRIVLMGDDCPSNRTENIQAAFESLRKSDVVLGPSDDGGYYLIGLRSYVFDLMVFEDIDWGSAYMLTHTVSTAAGVRLEELPRLCNVDTPEDIPSVISVVMPTLNDGDRTGPVLGRLLDSFGVEIIVVDGGSEDDTLACADAAGATVIETSPGRAHQMNAGAGVAVGKILLFIYPDTLLPKNWDITIRNTLSDDVVLGAFTFSVEERLPGIGLVEWSVRLYSHAFAQPGGEQGLFMKRATFEQVGGFPDQPILEDYRMVRRMRKLGRILTIDDQVVISARHWKKRGVFKTLLIDQLLIFAHGCHFPLKALRRLYD